MQRRRTCKQSGASAKERARSRRGAVRGLAATYIHACQRCGCTPAPEVATELAERGALIIDLRLCTSDVLAALCLLLREAPSGIRQVVLRDGLTTLGADSAYRERVAAYRRRAQSGALNIASLRLLVTALAAFMAVRGSRIAVLDLAGAPLGQEIASLVTPLSRALRDCRARQLRWLGLNGCRLGDRGLSLLLPWLAGKENTLPHLEALTLACNGLSDVRLIDALLRTRAHLCFERRAANLQLIDLSGNVHLGDAAPGAPGKAAPGSARRHGGQGVPRLSASARSQARRGALVRAAACAIAEGLPLRVLRLRRTHLDEESLQPLLQLMQVEKQRCLSSNGILAGASGFCLEELDLSENALEPSLLAAIAEGLKLLQTLREGLRGQSHPKDDEDSQRDVPPSPQQAEIPAEELQPACQRAHSEPCLSARSRVSEAHELQQAATVEALARDAMSDGEEYLRDTTGKAAAGKTQEEGSRREDFLLRRAEDRRRFRSDAKELSGRLPVRRSPQAPPVLRELGMDMWAPLAIAGTMGPTAAQSMVRQAVLEELCSCVHGATQSAASLQKTLPLSRQPTAVINNENRPLHSENFSTAGFLKGDPLRVNGESDRDSQAVASKVFEEPSHDFGVLWHAAPPLSPTSSEGEAEVEAQLLRAGRLEELRAEVLGTLAGTTNTCLETDSTPALSLNHARGRGSHGIEERVESDRSSYMDMRLDSMRQEALSDLYHGLTKNSQ